MGDVDPVAIWRAACGKGPVRLNRDERLFAAALILAAGGRQADLCARLGVSRIDAARLVARIRDAVGLDRAAWPVAAA